MAKVLTIEQESRLRELQARFSPNEKGENRGLSFEEEQEMLQILFNTPPDRSAFIISIERGEIDGDVIEL